MTARLALLVALAGLPMGCAKHPALTVGIAAGAVAGITGEANELQQKTVGLLALAVGLGLGGLTWLVTTFADTDAHQIPPDEEVTPEGTVKLHTHTDLPPVPIDAGVPDAPMSDAPLPVDAGADAA